MDNQALAPIKREDMGIMIVDDEPANVKLLEALLEVTGYTNTVSTTDPRTVCELYQRHHSDLILLDINMPHLDGYQVMKALRDCGGEQPLVLILSAQSDRDFRQRALDNGAMDYVNKPFDTHELLSRVRNLLEIRRAQRYMVDQNERLEREVQRRTQELHDSRLEVVRKLGRAAEYRDNETGLHIVRMSQITALIGGSHGLDEHYCDLLLNASPMHDIGKIGIPDHILLKPGRLDPEERRIMETHPTIGAEILAEDSSELLCMAREIALYHHEKWDGSGYPQCLDGEAIPLEARITAIADVFDALTSERPYKKAWPKQDAIDFISQQSGRHFDPGLVKSFLSVIPEISEVMGRHPDPID